MVVFPSWQLNGEKMSLKSTTNIPYLDGWRGVAIIAVFAGHFGPRGLAGWAGAFGVQVFFVLSGYLMSYLLFVKDVDLSDFFARRFSRVIPTFVLYVSAMILYARYLQPTIYPVGLEEASATFTFLRSYVPSGNSIWSDQWPIGHLWSLNVEEHSYVYLAFLALFSRRLASRLFLGAALAGTTVAILALNFYYPGHLPTSASPWYLRSECAALGLIAAGTLRFVRHCTPHAKFHAVPPLSLVLCLLVAVPCFAIYAHKGMQYTLAPLCMAFVINYMDRAPSACTRALAWAPLRWFGRCSFSLYLWQQPFFLAVLYFGMPKFLASTLGVVVGAISFYFFENPIRIRLNTAWQHRKIRLAREQSPVPR